MERDPHQLIEGILIACYAVGCCAGVPLRPGRDGAGPGAHRRRRSTRPTPPASSARTSSAPTSASTSSCTGAPAPTSSARRRRSSRASRATAACRASSRRSSRRPRACTCSPRSSTTSRRCRTSRRSSPTAATRSPRSAPSTSDRHAHVRGVGPRQEARRLTRSSSASPRSATCIYAPVYGGGIRDGQRAQGVHPRRRVGAVALRGAPRPAARDGRRRQGRLDARLGRHRGDGRDHRHGQGVPAARAVLRPRVVRQVHAVPRGHELAREDPLPHLDGHGRPERPRPAARRVRQHQPAASPGRRADHDLPARPVGRRRRSRRRSMRFRDEFEAYIGGPRRDHRRRQAPASSAAERRPPSPGGRATDADRRRRDRRRRSPSTAREVERQQGRAASSRPPRRTAPTSRASATTSA